MKAFARLYQSLDQTTSTNAKVAAMQEYLAKAAPEDAAWAIYFLSGRRIKRLIGAALLRTWLVEEAELPAWLVEDTYASVGDLAETIALLLAPTSDVDDSTSLSDWVENKLLALRGAEPEQQRAVVTTWWRTQAYERCYLINKLMTGALRVGVSQTLLARALAENANLPRAVILHRLMGEWQPNAAFYKALIAEDDGAASQSRPYPFCLAAPLDDAAGIDSTVVTSIENVLGPIADWQAEWKWDGIRAQLVRRGGETFLWSRGEELIGERFPEIVAAAETLEDGTVLDGELLAWKLPFTDEGVMPFSELQRRIGRKTVGKKLLKDVPCLFLAYDLLEADGVDLRETALQVRRARLEALIGNPESEADATRHSLQVSNHLEAADWKTLADLRRHSREHQVEGLMLKRCDSPYGTGRQRGLWWKWKIEPYTVDAVMIYAQAGHGRRANLFTDYTFAIWDEGVLVPFAKAYSGLANTEIKTLDKWIRGNTIERFGPVRSVKPVYVFELAFEGINTSSRHKSGIAVRFPRISRWRHDLAAKDADTLESVKRLIEPMGV